MKLKLIKAKDKSWERGYYDGQESTVEWVLEILTANAKANCTNGQSIKEIKDLFKKISKKK